MRRSALLYVNGVRRELKGRDALSPLSDYLRNALGLTGTKVVCAEGDCGACTVLVSRFGQDGFSPFVPVNACITTPALNDLSHILTVEALSDGSALHPVQSAMVRNHGAQCGFCTPGVVNALAGLYERAGGVTEKRVRDALTGNLCRCTGYEPILKAARFVRGSLSGALARRYLNDPAMNAELRSRLGDDLMIGDTPFSYFAPVTLDRFLQYKRDHPRTRVIASATDIGVRANKDAGWGGDFCSLGRIPECHVLAEDENGITVGSAVTLASLQKFVAGIYPEFHRLLHVFASPQIRNAATLAGNIANASPIADTLPFLFVMNAELELRKVGAVRCIVINDYYRGYKKTDLGPDEIITAVRIPKLRADEKLKLYKVSRRKDLDIACVTAGYLLKMSGNTCLKARVACGGVGPVVLRLPETEAFLAGKDCTSEVFERAGDIARTEVNPISDVRGGRDYRLKLVKNLFLKMYYEI